MFSMESRYLFDCFGEGPECKKLKERDYSQL
jgi:hypothetical protein